MHCTASAICNWIFTWPSYSHGSNVNSGLAWPAIWIRIRIRIRIHIRNRNRNWNRRGLLRKFLMNELTFCWPLYGKVQYCLPSVYTHKLRVHPVPPSSPRFPLWLIRYKSKVRLTWNWKLVSKKFATRHNHNGQLSRDKKGTTCTRCTVHGTDSNTRHIQRERETDVYRYVCYIEICVWPGLTLLNLQHISLSLSVSLSLSLSLWKYISWTQFRNCWQFRLPFRQRPLPCCGAAKLPLVAK